MKRYVLFFALVWVLSPGSLTAGAAARSFPQKPRLSSRRAGAPGRSESKGPVHGGSFRRHAGVRHLLRFRNRSTSHRQDACFSTSVGRSQAPPEVYVRTTSAPLYASPRILRSSSRRDFLLDEPIFLWIFRRWLRSVLAVILRRCEISSFESPSSTSSATRIS